ncbi:MAG: 30S ribosomal protein S9 [Pirellulales bacterium]|nr:30S ribosomal protein S9 [Pirellulales bacterium]
MATAQQDSLGTGRRKTSVARVRIRPGTGKILINKRELDEFFPIQQHQNAVMAALKASEEEGKVDVVIRVHGGGMTGQADAIKLGIARALRKFNEEHYEVLKENQLLTRDARKKERKKYGLHGARRGTQFSKR